MSSFIAYQQAKFTNKRGLTGLRLNLSTDYSLRMLLYLGLLGERASVNDVARAYGISKHHLVRVAYNLVKLGYLDGTRGRFGGLELARKPHEINLGKVVQEMQPTSVLVECFNAETNTCPIAPACGLKGVLARAEGAFYDVLSEYTLADLLHDSDGVKSLLNLGATSQT